MALVGQNGAGKSTMIKILTGAYRRDAGEVTFDGDRPVDFAVARRRRRTPASPRSTRRSTSCPCAASPRTSSSAREPRRFGLIDWRRLNARGARAILQRFEIDIDVERPLGVFNPRPSRWWRSPAPSAARHGSSSWTSRPPRSTSARSSVLFETIRTLKARRRLGDLRQPRLDELYAVCDRVTIMRDGRTVAVCRDERDPKLELVAAMLGRHLAQSGTRPSVRHSAITSRRCSRSTIWPPGARCAMSASRSAPGEIVGLAGLLGSGRTETARVVFGADRRDGGEIRVDGAPVALRRAGRRDRAGIGFCSEDRKVEGIVPDMSVAREPDAGAAAAPDPLRRRRRGAPARHRRALHRAARRQSCLARPARSASCRAATSRRCCWRAGSA